MAEATGTGAATAASTSHKAVRGGLWTMVGYGGGQVIRLGSSVIMTRLLLEADFGLMAVTWSVLTGLGMFSDLGLSTSIVQNKRGGDPLFRRTAFTLQALRAALIAVIACAVAPAVELWMPEYQGITALLCATALCTLVGGFESTSLALQGRDMALGRLSLLNLGVQVVTSATMIGWAWFHPSPWALVVGSLTGAVVKVVASHALFGADRFAWERDAARELFTFGKWIFLSTALHFLVSQADRLVFGKMIPPALLGVYSVGFQIAMIVPEVSGRLTGNVLFPAYCRTFESGEIASGFRRYRRPILLLVGWCMACVCAAGQSGIDFVYPSSYAAAGWMVQFLTLGFWFGHALQGTHASALLAAGQPRLLLFASVVKLVGMLVVIPLGFWLYGFPGAVAAYASTDVMRYIAIALSTRRLGVRALADDMRLTAWFAVTAVLGWAAQEQMRAWGGGAFTRCCVAVAVVSLAWAHLLLPALRDMAARLRR